MIDRIARDEQQICQAIVHGGSILVVEQCARRDDALIEIFPVVKKKKRDDDDRVCESMANRGSVSVTKRDDAMEWIARAFSIDDWP